MADFTTAEQTALANLGQTNAATYHPTTNPRGLAGVGYKTNVPQIANDTATVAPAFKRMADEAAAARDTAVSVAVNAPTAISDSTLTIASSGTKTFHTTTDLQTTSPFRPGMWITAIAATDASKAMWGYIPVGGLDYAADTMAMTVIGSRGSGSVSSWYILATGPQGAAAGLATVVQDAAPQLGGDLDSNGQDINIGAGSLLNVAANSGGIDMNGAVLLDAALKAATETVHNQGTVSNAVALDAANGHHFRMVLGGNATLTPPTALASGLLRPMLVFVKQAATGGPFTLGWAASVKWVGAAPAQSTTAGATDIYILQGLGLGGAPVYAGQVFGQGYTGLL